MTTFKALSYVVLSVSLGVIVSAQQPARGGGRGGPPPAALTKSAYVGHDKIPAGTPHWFKDVPQGISYFVVKPLKPWFSQGGTQ
jgi:hypothetical protein